MSSKQMPFSMRMSRAGMARLAAHARRRGETRSRTAERLIEEGLRMADHPGIVFRDGPAGRRAALAGGPDVWEVVETLQGSGEKGERAIAATAEWGSLNPAQVRTAVRYYAEHREEVDERIRLNREDADREHAAWRRAQDALA
ncbi:MAG: ribbon-helix-helix protein, CopG family [Thermoleophilaceae bacterium]